MGNRRTIGQLRRGRPRKPWRGPFAEWVRSTGKTNEQIADLVGVSSQAISNMLAGSKPGRSTAVAIARASGGAVGFDSWDRRRT